MPKTAAVDVAFTSWSPQVIRAAIAYRGMTLSKLAVDNGLNASACRQSLQRPQPKADRVISDFLGVPLCELWPDRYDAHGDPIRHVRANTTPERAGAHRQIVGAR